MQSYSSIISTQAGPQHISFFADRLSSTGRSSGNISAAQSFQAKMPQNVTTKGKS
jgi:hypothetical protein